MTQKTLKKEAIAKSPKVFEDPNLLPSVPNLLTLSRIALIPIIVAAFYTDNYIGRWVATVAFICGCLTDFLDGYVARLWSQTSKFGQFLDPVADKLLVASTLLMLVGFGRIQPLSFFPAIIILCREILVSGLREYLSNNQVFMPVTALAKWKTMAQMVAISFLLIGNTTPFGNLICTLGEILLWLAAGLTLITGYSYLKSHWQHL